MNLKKLTHHEFGKIKSFLSLSTVGEVMRSQSLGKDTVMWVDASENWQDYMDTYYLIKKGQERKLREETERAAGEKYENQYDKLDFILEELRAIKELMQK